MRAKTRFCRNLTGQSLTPPPQAKTGREESFQTRVSSRIFGFGYGRVMYGELSEEAWRIELRQMFEKHLYQ